MKRMRPNAAALSGLVLFAVFAGAAVFADLLAPFDPWRRFEPYRSPDAGHLLGTNDIGNDVLSELVYGGRATLVVGLGTGLIAVLIGTAAGVLAGYFGGAPDEVLMGMTDAVLMIPRIPAVIIIGALLKPTAPAIALILGLLWWTGTARVVRSRVLQIRRMPFILGQKALGFTDARIMLTDVLPHLAPIVAPKLTLTVASAMITEASLSFLGLGDASAKSWGTMIRFAFERGGFIRGMWWWYAAPGAAVTLCVLSLALIGSALAERSDPLAAGPPG